MTSYRVRLATEADVEFLPGIELAAGELFVGIGMADVAGGEPTSVEVHRAALARRQLWVVADGHDQAVGFALMKEVDGAAYLQEISVHPAHGRRGLGGLLLKQVCTAARAAGFTAVTLSTFRSVRWNGPWYRGFGFRDIPEPELTPGLLEVRQREARAGLDVAARVFMKFELEDEQVHVVAYDPTWPARFEAERRLVADAAGEWICGAIEHIGSTAVPGLAAKPVIDIMAAVTDLETSRPAIAALEGAGYLFFPYKADVMHWFCKPSRLRRTHHLHLVPFGSRLWTERLAFRDHLRSHPDAARAYAELKQRLAAEFQHDREAYTEGKGPFVEAVLQRALARRT